MPVPWSSTLRRLAQPALTQTLNRLAHRVRDEAHGRAARKHCRRSKVRDETEMARKQGFGGKLCVR
jgi:hypothetical protein